MTPYEAYVARLREHHLQLLKVLRRLRVQCEALRKNELRCSHRAANVRDLHAVCGRHQYTAENVYFSKRRRALSGGDRGD